VVRFTTSNGVTTNAAMRPKQVREHCALDSESTGYLEQAMKQKCPEAAEELKRTLKMHIGKTMRRATIPA